MVEVERKPNETMPSFLRRFSRRVQQSGILLIARKGRFHQSSKSKRELRDSAVHRAKMRKKYDRLRKLGKLPQKKKTGRRRG